MAPAARVKRICCTETSFNRAPVPLIIKKSPVAPNSAAPNDEHVTFVTRRPFLTHGDGEREEWNPPARLTAPLGPVGYCQTRHMHVAPEIKNKSAFGGGGSNIALACLFRVTVTV